MTRIKGRPYLSKEIMDSACQDLALKYRSHVEVVTTGVAYAAGVCLSTKVGLLEDDGLFHTGVHTAAHELAHLLGCPHDGDPAPPALPNSPGAESCSGSDGFLMSSDLTGTTNKNQYHLSPCCQDVIRYVAGMACWNSVF
ncbi:venom metalloproteinase antarease TserMP_A-like [Ixodes scapularis]|uniref:venom metalloproteinase antarease TserMP_A-like n=1 Tax=Ixodes scapularis TaxID=6945 RepID=UPI001C386A89|nr:venom metalloproteinase antarease TserMP_A-like [Ixodes scapularis]